MLIYGALRVHTACHSVRACNSQSIIVLLCQLCSVTFDSKPSMQTVDAQLHILYILPSGYPWCPGAIYWP